MRSWKLIVFLACHAGIASGQAAQWHFSAAGGVVASFGPSDNQAELVGGQNSLSYDGKQHLSPAFQAAASFEVSGGLSKKEFSLDGTWGWFHQPMTLVLAPASSSDGPALATMDMMNFRLAPTFRVTGISNEDHQGIWLGMFAGVLFPIQTSIEPELTTLYGITAIQSSAQFNWGGSFRGVFRIGRSGLFGFSEATITMPGIVGSVGSFQLDPGSSYSLIRNEIKMYSIRLIGGLGYILARRSSRK